MVKVRISIMTCMMLTIILDRDQCLSFMTLKTFIMDIQHWRCLLPDTMQWMESDQPSKDINAARMRARYYEICYIILRPLLRLALQVGGHQKLPAGLQRFCNVCVTSAMRSIEAFDSIEDCQVMTNIFGTAHSYDSNDPSTNLLGMSG